MKNEKQKNVVSWFKTSITIKMIVIGVLMLLMLIPLSFVQDLIKERASRQQAVIDETNLKWGKNVILSGPILKIPYKKVVEEKEYNKISKSYSFKETSTIQYAYFLPEDLEINSDVKSKTLDRSIYESVVYTSAIQMKGNFKNISFAEKDIKAEDILWEKATVFIETTNLKGIKSKLEISVAGINYSLTPNYLNQVMNRVTTTSISGLNSETTNDKIPFSFSLKVNGSESLEFIPLGKQTSLKMASDWHSPSFFGEFLPEDDKKEISKDGFKAEWNILQINRQFEQSFFDSFPDLSKFSFGTKFVYPVDEYQKSERSAKYGFLIIALTFLAFFLIQLVSKIYIHPFQYTMIGLALIMFYTLLVSISEHSTFLKAYLIAGVSVITLIGLYARTIFKSYKFIVLIVLSLLSLYGFVYVIIQLENYALLVGSIGLFVILAIIMYATRKIDWGNQE